MARIKFGSIVVSGAGSLGGHTIQNSSGGAQLRTKPINKANPTFSQSLIRSYNPQLQAGWRALSSAQRDFWSHFAAAHQVNNKNGDPHALSGHSLWLKYNFDYIKRGLPFISDPGLYGPPFLGPELLINGSFSSATVWVYGAPFSISSGHLNYAGTPTSYTYQPLPLVSGSRFLLSFFVSFLAGTGFFSFRTQSAAVQLFADIPLASPFSNGSHSLLVTCINSSTQFRFNTSYLSGAGYFDNFSLKQVFE